MREMKFYKQIRLKNGTKLSVQASAFHYCYPKINELESWEDYKTVEVGFIHNEQGGVTPPESWSEYAVDDFPSYSEDGSIDVYGYVPVEKVLAFISNGNSDE
jgi:hypothetical protein